MNLKSRQLSFVESGAPIADTTFVVIDCETTGLSPSSDKIIEIAVSKICGGVEIGNLQSLLNPGFNIPVQISKLTGIENEKLLNSPTFDEMAPTLIEFIGNHTIVGHNISFDVNFINCSLEHAGYEKLENKTLDTLTLARKIIPGEVRNYKLNTLARYIRADNHPTHRAMSDVKATVEVFHFLIERSSFLGVSGINDLFKMPSKNKRQRFAKKSLASNAPNSPGVYIFIDEQSHPLYIGTSKNIRTRLSSYFSSDDRRRISKMLSRANKIEYVTTPTPLEARIAEIRLLQALSPEFNVRDVGIPNTYFVGSSKSEQAPTFRVYSYKQIQKRNSLSTMFGPFNSRKSSELFKEAINFGFGLRTCAHEIESRKFKIDSPCIDSIRGRHSCFCSGDQTGLQMYMKRYESKIRRFKDDYHEQTKEFLAHMQDFSKELKFEQAKTMHEYALVIQKWMNRFSLIEHYASFNHEGNKELPPIENGLATIRYRIDDESSCSSYVEEILNSEDHSGFKSNNNFVCNPKELKERFYLAIFLERKNFLSNKLKMNTPITVTNDHRNTRVTNIP